MPRVHPLPSTRAAAVTALLALGAGGVARAQGVAVKVENPLDAPRAAETVAVSVKAIRALAAGLEPGKLVVVDDAKRPVPSQLVDLDGDDGPDELVFQLDLPAHGARSVLVQAGERAPAPRDAFRAYGRFVRERHDDFAWENDRIAHRVYGPGLETAAREPLISSGFDVWVKRVPRLVVNEWYMTDDYHRDKGDGADMYAVGKSRGCGGLGIWTGDKLAVSRNFMSSRVLANGPIRLEFELTYPPWKAGDSMLSETKRITLDAGSNFDRVETFRRRRHRQARGGRRRARQEGGLDAELGAAQAGGGEPRLRHRPAARHVGRPSGDRQRPPARLRSPARQIAASVRHRRRLGPQPRRRRPRPRRLGEDRRATRARAGRPGTRVAGRGTRPLSPGLSPAACS